MKSSRRSASSVVGKRKTPPPSPSGVKTQQHLSNRAKKRKVASQQRPHVVQNAVLSNRKTAHGETSQRGSKSRAQRASLSLRRETLQKQIHSVLRTEAFGVDSALYKALNVATEQELKDLLNCLILSEGAYKIVDMSRNGASKMVRRMKSLFPPGLVTVERVQWSLPSVDHRYLLADDKDTLYVAFMGTKQRRDLVTNAAVLQEPIWPDLTTEAEQKSGAMPAAHRGFLSRAKAIPIEGLYAHACRQGKRLVLTGHSLGAAVAQLSALRLFKQLPLDCKPAVRCVSFACPAIGNQALSDCVRSFGWEDRFNNLLVPEDVVPRLLASPAQSPEQVAAATIKALQPEEAQAIGDEVVESVLVMFDDIFAAVTADDPLLIPSLGPASLPGMALAPDFASSARSSPRRVAGHTPTMAAAEQPLVFGVQSGEVGQEQWKGQNIPRNRPTDKQLAIEAAELFKSLQQEEEEEVMRTLKEEEGTSLCKDGNESESEGSPESEEEEWAELAQLRGEHVATEASAKAGSARAGRSRRRVGRERLTANEEVFFPWSVKPLPSFAREFAGRALKTAGSLSRFPFPRSEKASGQQAAATSSFAVSPAANGVQSSPSRGPQNEQSTIQNLPGYNRLSEECSPAVFPSLEKDWRNPDRKSGENIDSSLAPSASTAMGAARKAGTTLTQQTESNSPLHVDREGSGTVVTKRWLSNSRGIGKLGAGVGRAASGAARGAARIVSAPLRVAQKSYAVMGKQSFLSSARVVPATGGDAEQTFQKGLEGATKSSRASALAFPGSRGASPSTIVSLQLPIAAARRRQPFLMHKMAFHRARLLSIVECTLAASGLEIPKQAFHAPGNMLSDDIAPIMKPSRAEVFLPYSLPDDQDLKGIFEDLGTLSALPPMTALPQDASVATRFQWLKPWRWISGFGWGGATRRGSVELTVQVRGKGLEHCSSVQVQDTEKGIWCQTDIIYRPQQPSPKEMYNALGHHREGVVHRLARLAFWARDAAREVTNILDRTNSLGATDCLLVKVYLPLEVMKSMESRLLQQAGEESGLTMHMTSDFRKVEIPLQVHGGGSWVVSDIRSSSQSLNDWVSQNITG